MCALSSVVRGVVIVAILAVLPYVLEIALRVEFPVHDHGVVVVTGASSGIGRDAALELASLGYVVFGSVRKQTDAENLAKAFSKMKAPNKLGNLIPIILDVANTTQISEVFSVVSNYVSEKKLPFVGLVNNAGISTRIPFESSYVHFAQNVMNINFFSVLEISQKFLPLIRKFQGRILFVSSVMGQISCKGSALYSASKHAMEAAVDALRPEMLEFQVSVSIVQPGAIATSIFEKAIIDPVASGISEEQVKLYQYYWDNITIKRREVHANSEPSNITTTPAIVHALTDKYPKTRYIVGRVRGLPVTVVDWLDFILPDRLTDRLRKHNFA